MRDWRLISHALSASYDSGTQRFRKGSPHLAPVLLFSYNQASSKDDCRVKGSSMVCNSLLLALGLLCVAAGIAEATPAPASPVKPLVGVYASESDLANAKNNIARYDWAKREWNRIKEIADLWLTRDDEWIRKVVPPKGSTFSYGSTGCPICGASWGWFGKLTCSWDKPGVVTCPGCKHEFPDSDPKSPYHDSGKGFSIDGRAYYPTGVWNAWVVEQMTAGFDYDNSAIRNLAMAYALTGDQRYAHKAAVILDALATVQPTTIGPRDFTTDPNSLQGRFHQLTSIVFRAKVHQVNAYDLIGRLDELDKPSATNPGLTMRQNIVQNMLDDYLFLHMDIRGGKLETLHNHEGDCVRGMLAVGMVTGNPDYIRWGLDAISYYIGNTIDRDGQYYETSPGYSTFGTSVIFDMAQVAANYSPDHYPHPERFPNPKDYPYNLNFFNNPKLATACLRQAVDFDCAGHVPGFGNAHGSLAQIATEQEPSVNAQMADLFYAKSTDPAIRGLAASRLINSSKDKNNIARDGLWCMLYAKDLTSHQATPALPKHSTLLGGRDIAILRSGDGANRRAAFLRGGCTLPHGHDDELGLLLYGKGRDLSFEIGYGIYGTPVHFGWSARQASHNVVVVDEDAKRPDAYYRRSPGGGEILFGQEGPISVTEMDSLSSRVGDNLTMYRRAIAQIDISPDDAYWVDVFRVAGGRQHDYIFHGSWGKSLADFGIDGVHLIRPEAWTVAGLNPEYKDAYFDRQGRSWGERIVPGEYIKEMDDPTEKIGGRGWIPPPGNGYGFLYDVRTGKASAPWSAEWRGLEPNDTRLRMISLPQAGTQVISSLGPTLDGKHQMHYVIARRGGADLQSRFVSVFVPYRDGCPITKIDEIALSPTDPMAVCVKIALADGRVDYVLSATDSDKRFTAIDGKVRIAFDGQYGLVRTKDGLAQSVHLFKGTELNCGEKSASLPKAAIEGTIVSTDDATKTISIDAHADPALLIGRVALIHSQGSPREAAYVIADANTKGDQTILTLQSLDFVLARGVLETNPEGNVIHSRIPVPYSTSIGVPTRYFDGSPIRNVRTGKLDEIRTFTDMKTFAVDNPGGWKAGDAFEILDFAPGDQVSIPLSTSL